jgi:phage terminase small subunit
MSSTAKNIYATNFAGLTFGPASDDDRDTVGESGGCTVKQDAFALAYAETGNLSAAYRIAYDVDKNAAPNTISRYASRLYTLPHVRKRVREYQQQFAVETIATVRELAQLEWDIATADPNEITYIAKRACRNCYGVGHAHQWRDEAEFIEAMAKAIDENKRMPTDEGGYGFTRAREPAPDCPECLGLGNPEAVINDTRNLTGKALKLYAGLDYKAGQWLVKMHDQAKAREAFGRIIGAFKDILDIRTPGEKSAGEAFPEGLTEAQAAQWYRDKLG